VWWSGLNVNDCRRGIAALGDELQVERWKSRGERGAGRDFYVHADARTRGFRRGSVLLLPAFDEYLIGYKSRDIVLHPDHSHHAHNNSGIFYPIVALDGYIVGNWSPSAHDGDLTLFDESTVVPTDPFHAQLATYRSTLKSKR
jgi:hypothetical protein